MNDLLLERYNKWIDPLSDDLKLLLINMITKSMMNRRKDQTVNDKQFLFEKLKGSWKDVDDDIEMLIYSSRTISDRDINLDS